ncbi:MAG: ABC transporter permease [Coriobacteriales bacterium]|jgi:ABC-type transport system involved in multi-copper enzyme maturation permease subunit|nr:ABC transporter permease [Coriobacteriales bacterium]
MLRLTKYEFKRLFHSKSFWIFLAIVVFFSAFQIVIMANSTALTNSVSLGMLEVDTTDGNLLNDESIQLLGIDGLISGAGDHLITLLPILLSIFIASDFSNKTLRNVVAKGYAKYQVYLAKFFCACFATTIFVIISSVIASVLSSILWGFSNAIIDYGKTASIFLAKLMSFYGLTSITVLVSMTVQNIGGSVAINIVITRFAPYILTSVATLLGEEINAFSKYEISTVINSLPDTSAEFSAVCFAFLVSIVYLAISNAVGTYVFQKRDL